MGRIHNEEFKREAVRIALTSGLMRRQVAADLKVGHSTLAKWIQWSRPEDLPPKADIDLAKENERLRKENRLLLEERELLKKSHGVLRGPKQMRFAFVKEQQKHMPIDRLCRILGVTARGYRAWRRRPISRRQRDDMVLLAHIRDQHHLSLGSYGRPRMTQELRSWVCPLVIAVLAD